MAGDGTKILQFNDCAFVARSLTRAALDIGQRWDYLPPEQVRPMTAAPSNPVLAKARFVPYLLRRRARLSAADVVHVHYGTSVRLIQERGMPKRPYLLTLHGTDIRRQWKEPQFHDEIQRAIDNAEHVFYANTDNQTDALQAREDAEFFPSVIDLASLPDWSPSGAPKILFISRWDDDKGVTGQLELVRMLAPAVVGKAELVGLDWGPGAKQAESLGVRLLAKLPQAEYHREISSAWLGIGQASDYFSTSEFEAMSIGLPLAALGSRLPRPDDHSVPPVLEGNVQEVIDQVIEALPDPVATAESLAGRSWARPRYDARNYVERLNTLYHSIEH